MVTSAVQVEMFPLASVTVRVTVLAPRSAQVNELGLGAKVNPPQLSVDPPSISVDTMVALPEASSCTVISVQTALGSMSSSTVTVDVQVDVFPLGSVAIKVTVFAPTSVQENASGVAESETEQLSADPLSTSFAVMETFPEASN